MKKYDLNKDGVIDSEDEIFAELKLWQDHNRSGKSTSEEIQPISSYGINSIDLSVKKFNGISKSKGNRTVATSHYYVTSPSGDQIKRRIYDLNLGIHQANSKYNNNQDKEGSFLNYIISGEETSLLPNSRGYGNLHSWKIALSKDTILLKMMENLVYLQNGTNYKNLDEKVELFLYRWAGVESDKQHRGVIDSKKVAFSEKFRGKPFIDNIGRDKVSYSKAKVFNDAWNKLVLAFKAKILIQGTFKEVFEGSYYDVRRDSLKMGSLSTQELATNIIEKYHSLNQDDKKYFIQHIESISDSFLKELHPLRIEQFRNDLNKEIGINFVAK